MKQPPTSLLTRVTVNLPTNDLDALKELAAKKKTSVTNVLRQAIGTELYLNEREREGDKVLLEHPDGSFSQLIRD